MAGLQIEAFLKKIWPVAGLLPERFSFHEKNPKKRYTFYQPSPEKEIF
jgi:hypothetical protein